MYSFVDQVIRHRRTILCLTVFAAFLLATTEAQPSSASVSSSDGLLPCSYRGKIIFHGDELIVDECTTCSCDNSTVKCDIKSCPPTFCEEPLQDPAECCDLCPYYVPVWEMNPRNIDIIREGIVNDLSIDLNLKINDKGQGVEGEGLWKVGMWASANEDGSGDRVGFIENVLTEGQAATQLVRPPIFGGFQFTIPGIEYSLDSTGASCPEMVFLCVEFGIGDEPDPVYPQLPFDVEGVESEEDNSPNPQHVIGCDRFPKCEGVTVSGLQAGYSSTQLTAGKKDPVRIDATASFTDTSIDLSGSGLWRLAMYGSKNADGTGEQFQRVENALSSSQQSQRLAGGQPIAYNNAKAEIDVVAIGCNDFNYVCFDYMQGESPSPSYTFRTLQEPDTSKYTVCNEKACEAGITIERTDASLISGSVVDGREKNDYSIRYSAFGNGVNVEGTGLWQLTAYGSANADGSGEQLNPTTETFDARQASTKFTGGQTMNYGQVDFNYDMTDQTCESVQFICLELDKGPESSAYFELEADPEDATTSCVPAECEGVIARNFQWGYSVEGAAVPGKETPLNVEMSMDTVRGSRSLQGEGLWRMGLYGSKNRDGSGERSGYKEQILAEAKQATGMEGNGQSMAIQDIETDFDVGTIGCTDFEYICSEFTKGPMPEPDFKFEIQGRRPEEGNMFTDCKKQECLAKAIFTGLEASILGEGPLIEGMQDNAMEMDLSGIVGAGSTLVEGSNLWTVGMFASSSQTGSGRKLGYQEQILSDAMQAQSLEPPANLDFSAVPVNFDMRGISCEDARYICTKLSKNEAATPNYKFKADPSERVLTRCVDMQDRCQGVVVTDLDWDKEDGVVNYGQPTDLSLNVNVGISENSRDVEGTGLWRLGMYGSQDDQGLGEKRGYVSQVLDPFEAGKSLEGGVDLSFNELETQFNMYELGCSDFKFMCVEFTKGYGADPNYAFKVEGGGDRIVKCKPEDCKGVFVTSTESTPDSMMLYEGNPSNYMTFDSAAQTTEASGPVVGLNMWNMALYGSERPNGEGEQYGRQEQVLSAYHSSIPLREPGQVLSYADVATNFDMTGLTCAQVKHMCTELSRNPQSSVDFELTGVPDETVLKDCFEVPDGSCKGVVITDMDWDMEIQGDVKSGKADRLAINMNVDSLVNSGSVEGEYLWRVGMYGSTNPQGTGAKKLDYERQILSPEQSGRSLRAGETMEIPYIETEFDLTKVGCEEEFQYLCLEYTKGQRAEPDFMFEVQQGGDQIVRCKKQECRKGVKLRGLEIDNLAQGQQLLEGSRTNRLLFDLEGLAAAGSGGASGDNLWEMSVWASTREDCEGPRMNEQQRDTLSRYQMNKDVRTGEDVSFGAVDMNFDMSGLTCDEARYMCVELKKGSRPRPDFELEAVPSADVLKKSFRHDCAGVEITRTGMQMDSNLVPLDGRPMKFDATLASSANGADARGSNMWNMETFLSSNPDGQGSRNLIERQVLTSTDSSRDLNAGGEIRFSNLEAAISPDQINCDETTYLCIEVSQGGAAQPAFTMSAQGDSLDSYRNCKPLKCQKPPPDPEPGPKGFKGEPGAMPRWEDFPPGQRGPAGIPGPSGGRGPNGYKGPPGGRGPKGPPGRDGKNGLPGQVGAEGRPGPAGDVIMAPQRSKGPAFRPQPQLQLGPPGAPGHPGATGAAGLYGMRGAPGEPGRAGNAGNPGGPGPRGSPGEDGNHGRNGNSGPPGGSGANGARGPSGRPGRSGMSGSKGHRGRRGVTGARGERGGQGESGSRGRQGAAGAIGLRGPSGLVGEVGNRGSRGAAGERGATGPTGEIGGVGPAGSQGPAGATGFGGAKGDAGESGDLGETGARGEPGENGKRGAPGNAGAMGTAGTPGSSGGLGDTGVVGAPGGQGMPGRRGQAGPAGSAGPRGDGGSQGLQGRQGSTGQQGSQGARGEAGGSGPQGRRGQDGDVGEVGLAGSAGPRGSPGERGLGGPSGRPGAMGQAGMRGNNGEAGAAGPAGPEGDDGEAGRAGAPGRPGERGPSGPDGTPGNDGKPGPPGTAGSEGRPGPSGPTGLIGAPGNVGPAGITGPAGADGSRGRPGNQGPRGAAGEEGKQGNQGVQGATGRAGSRGESGPQGEGGPPGGIGPLGQQGTIGARGLRGLRGPTGGAGAPGGQGQEGERGAQGAMGLRGPSGEDGPQGLEGRDGQRGEDGSSGPNGDQGVQGIRGLPGQPGQVGPAGGAGAGGERGESGAPGPEGTDGRPGERGAQGSMGPAGQQGPRGQNGDSGEPGRTGLQGATGPRGEIGAAGNAGQSGPPGVQGPLGPVGAQGEKGPRGERGVAGVEGAQGGRGRLGPAGPMGSRGGRGETGPGGANGPQGSPGPNGPRGAAGERGEVGPGGITGPSGNVGRPGSRGSAGEQGPRGQRGPVGLAGKNGNRGEDGNDGNDGSSGPMGLSGPSGPPGIGGGPGRMGPTGPAGLGGRSGSDGAQGQKGPSGSDGPDGSMGEQGPAGPRGSSGSDGQDGLSGPSGPQGSQGSTGEDGPQGAQGRAGMMGRPGPQGVQGAQGQTGSRGRTGISGPSGPEGQDGPTGPIGPMGSQGPRGETGSQGLAGGKGHDAMPGPPGAAGKKGSNGRTGERGGNGPIGPAGNDGENGRTGNAGQRGPRGFAGPGGSRGGRGTAGPEGMAGPPGRPGPPGPVEYYQPQYVGTASTGKGPDPYSYTYRDMPAETEEVEDGRLRATFSALHFELIKMVAPQGTEDNPARTCRDIFRCHPQKESGIYWIDPNEGSPDDKFQVYCNKKTLESCIDASPATAQNGTWYTGEPGHRLFSDMDDGFEFTYPVNTIQLTFLRLLTNKARQTVTYHCKNSVAAYDAEARNMDMAMRLITTTEAELTADGKSTFRYNIVKDGCQRRTGNWEKTVLEYKTKKNTRLPIVNVAPADIGGPGQEFGLEIGPVCFS